MVNQCIKQLTLFKFINSTTRWSNNHILKEILQKNRVCILQLLATTTHCLIGILSQHLFHTMFTDPMINIVANAQSSGLIKLNSLTPIETLMLSSMGPGECLDGRELGCCSQGYGWLRRLHMMVNVWHAFCQIELLCCLEAVHVVNL